MSSIAMIRPELREHSCCKQCCTSLQLLKLRKIGRCGGGASTSVRLTEHKLLKLYGIEAGHAWRA